MALSPQLLCATLSLGSVFLWGTSDFAGGYAARRANAFVVAMIGHVSGTLLMLALSVVQHAVLPSLRSVAWSAAAGCCGGFCLALFYRALATGKMGLIAPVSAVLGAVIPALFSIWTEGMPGALSIAGFLLAGLGIWLISRTEEGHRPGGLGLAFLAGLGFAGYFLFIKQAGSGSSALWVSMFSRLASFVVTGVIVLGQRNFREIVPASAGLGAFAGCVDVLGSAFFVRASQIGRLDTAVVISSLYPAITVLLARLILHEHFSRWRAAGMFAALLAVPLIALQ